tara:strand:+ start:789 stop:953 length:165 start_codon:yes stop_codon:yes gene_type:complete
MYCFYCILRLFSKTNIENKLENNDSIENYYREFKNDNNIFNDILPTYNDVLKNN